MRISDVMKHLRVDANESKRSALTALSKMVRGFNPDGAS